MRHVLYSSDIQMVSTTCPLEVDFAWSQTRSDISVICKWYSNFNIVIWRDSYQDSNNTSYCILRLYISILTWFWIHFCTNNNKGQVNAQFTRSRSTEYQAAMRSSLNLFMIIYVKIAIGQNRISIPLSKTNKPKQLRNSKFLSNF